MLLHLLNKRSGSFTFFIVIFGLVAVIYFVMTMKNNTQQNNYMLLLEEKVNFLTRTVQGLVNYIEEDKYLKMNDVTVSYKPQEEKKGEEPQSQPQPQPQKEEDKKEEDDIDVEVGHLVDTIDHEEEQNTEESTEKKEEKKESTEENGIEEFIQEEHEHEKKPLLKNRNFKPASTEELTAMSNDKLRAYIKNNFNTYPPRTGTKNDLIMKIQQLCAHALSEEGAL